LGQVEGIRIYGPHDPAARGAVAFTLGDIHSHDIASVLDRENILDHYCPPRNKGRLENPTHSHEEQNPLCGDVIRVDLHVTDDNVIDHVSFEGRGCAISQAPVSMLIEMIRGKTFSARAPRMASAPGARS
jgi:SUF system NifU family Fe-S assembly protein